MKRFVSVLILAAAASASSAQTEVQQVIQCLRQSIASEEMLDSIQSLRMSGDYVDRATGSTSRMILSIAKPYYYHSEVISGSEHRVIAVNGYEGFIHVFDKKDPAKIIIRVLPAETCEFLMVSARENLYFFKGPSTTVSGQVYLNGETIKFGKPTYKLRFDYPAGINFLRYVSKDGCQLISTVISSGNTEIIEDEYTTFQGLRFPSKIRNLTIDGYLTSTITFDKFEVNPELDKTLFDIPKTVSAPVKP